VVTPQFGKTVPSDKGKLAGELDVATKKPKTEHNAWVCTLSFKNAVQY